jgi:hypothetical protein
MSDDDPTEQDNTKTQEDTPNIILEPHHIIKSTLQLNIEQNVTNQPRKPHDHLNIKQTNPKHQYTIHTNIPATNKLITTTNNKKNNPILHNQHNRATLHTHKITNNHHLITILPSTKIIKIILTKNHIITHTTFIHLQNKTAPFKTTPKHNNISPINIDVHFGGVQVAEPHKKRISAHCENLRKHQT